ncbi:TetR/AcrR family transcriptional regulator [Fructilactobacillus sp. Tb1]|uniref:TetR/AcrR family transcriptional regulator n=1 Tax=Fructilactobacillus sp. Tb1 TaxID=3422304 RepID=UPI003D2AB184
MEKISNVSRKTMNRISDALLSEVSHKRLSEVKVNNIIATAAISRKTFYNHFDNINEVIDYTMKKVNDDLRMGDFFEVTDRDELIEKGLERLPDGIYNNRDEIEILYTSDLKGPWKDFLMQQYGSLVDEVLFKDYTDKLLPKSTASNIFTFVLIALADDWVKQSVPVTPDVIRQQVLEILNTTPGDLLSKSM